MGLFEDELGNLRLLLRDARWKVQTVARVGFELGMHKDLHVPGAKVLAREFSRGRANVSTLFRFRAANDPDAPALIQAGLPGKKQPGAPEAGRLTYAQADDMADRIALGLSRRGVGRGSAV